MEKSTPHGGLLTMGQAAVIFGFTSGGAAARRRRVLRFLVRLEARADGAARLLIHVSGEGRGARYMVSREGLRDHLPELFSRRDQAAAEVREFVEQLREEAEEAADRVDLLAETLSDTMDRVLKIEQQISLFT